MDIAVDFDENHPLVPPKVCIAASHCLAGSQQAVLSSMLTTHAEEFYSTAHHVAKGRFFLVSAFEFAGRFLQDERSRAKKRTNVHFFVLARVRRERVWRERVCVWRACVRVCVSTCFWPRGCAVFHCPSPYLPLSFPRPSLSPVAFVSRFLSSCCCRCCHRPIPALRVSRCQ